MPKVLVIPDLHAPYHHPNALDFLRGIRDGVRPDRVVCLGDEADLHRLSSHAQSPDLPGPADEIGMAREALAPFFREFPRADVCWSNHVRRLHARASEAGIPSACLREWGDILGAPRGWSWADSHEIDGVLYVHGDGLSGKHAARLAPERFRRSVVFGHLHTVCGVSYTAGFRDRLFGLAAGCLIDPSHPAYSYCKYDAARPVLACAVINDGVCAQVIPMR